MTRYNRMIRDADALERIGRRLAREGLAAQAQDLQRIAQETADRADTLRIEQADEVVAE